MWSPNLTNGGTATTATGGGNDQDDGRSDRNDDPSWVVEESVIADADTVDDWPMYKISEPHETNDVILDDSILLFQGGGTTNTVSPTVRRGVTIEPKNGCNLHRQGDNSSESDRTGTNDDDENGNEACDSTSSTKDVPNSDREPDRQPQHSQSKQSWFQGNQRFQAKIDARRDEYATKNRLERPLVAVEILHDWRYKQSPPGRFLVRQRPSHVSNPIHHRRDINPNNGPTKEERIDDDGTSVILPLWKDVGDKRARAYISKCLQKACRSPETSDGTINAGEERRRDDDNNNNNHIDNGIDNFVSTTSQQDDSVNGMGGHHQPDLQEHTELDRRSTTGIQRPIVCNTSVTTGGNDMPPKLYERDEQIRQLQEAVKRSVERRGGVHGRQNTGVPSSAPTSELVLICGPSGSGKSELARVALLETVTSTMDGFLLWGKFDRQAHRRMTDCAAFFAAFHDYTKQLQQKGDQWVAKVRRSVQEVVGEEMQLLVNAMPFLSSLFIDERKGNTKPNASSLADDSMLFSSSQLTMQDVNFIPDGSNDRESATTTTALPSERNNRKRFIMAMRHFVRALLDPDHPIVLVLDDLQWADDGSLVLLHSLVSPREFFGGHDKSCGLLIVGTCRGNEVGLNDPLSVHLRRLEDEGTTITSITVSNLSVETLMQMIVDTKTMPPGEDAYALAKNVHQQTKGNAFFSMQYLQNLRDDGFQKRGQKSEIRKSEDTSDDFQVLADDTRQSGNSILHSGSDQENDIVRLIAMKMLQSPPDVQEVLKVAATIGSDIRESLLVHACGIPSSNVLPALSAAEERGFISYDFDACRGRFAHDRFQEAALSLVKKEDRSVFHLQIGRTLSSRLSEKEFSESLLLIVGMMVQGVDHIDDEGEREELAKLCLAAARTAAESSAFSSAIRYIEYGLNLLRRKRWRHQHELSLELYSTGCELAYCNGDYELVDELAKPVIDNARSTRDKVRVQTTRVLSLDSQWNFEGAFQLCYDMLCQYGEKFPKRAGNVATFVDLAKTRRMLRGKSADDILNLPQMTDHRALTAMTFVYLLFQTVSLNNFSLVPLLACRLVRLTLRYGLSSMSSVGFGLYAALLVRLKHEQEGYYFGNLALQVFSKYPVREYYARTAVVVWGNVHTEMYPLRDCLKHFVTAKQAGFQTGDYISSMLAIFMVALMRFFIGDPLQSMVNDLVHSKELAKEYKQRKSEVWFDPLLQACYNLQNRSKDPLILTGEVMNETTWNVYASDARENLSVYIVGIKILLGVLMNQIDVELLAAYRKRNKGVYMPYMNRYFTFCEGLIEAGRAKTSMLSRWRAQRSLRSLEKAMLQCPENHTNKVFLIRAELDTSAGRYDNAILKYDISIRYAEKEHFLFEQALATEKAARMLLRTGKKAKAAKYLNKATKLYQKWGATVKVIQLKDLIAKEMVTVVDKRNEIL